MSIPILLCTTFVCHLVTNTIFHALVVLLRHRSIQHSIYYRHISRTSMVTAIDLHTIWQRTFKGENIHEFHGFRPTHESFLHKRNLGMLCPLMIGFSIPQKFSPSKVPRCTVVCIYNTCTLCMYTLYHIVSCRFHCDEGSICGV